jgi:hypothetical protein
MTVHPEKYNRPEDLGRTINNLRTDVQSLQVAETTGSRIYPYTPVWASVSGVQPSIGDGSLLGHYVTKGALIWCKIELTIGTTTTQGDSTWTFTLPFPAVSSMGSFVGSGLAINSGVGAYPGTSLIEVSEDANVMMFYHVDPTDTTIPNRTSAVQPPGLTWGSTDKLIGEIEYAPDWEDVEMFVDDEAG